MPVKRAMETALWARRSRQLALLAAMCMLVACGGKKLPELAGVGTGAPRDASAAKDKDAGGVDAANATRTVPPTTQPTPPIDAGHGRDASMPPATPSDEDAGPHCTARECGKMSDDCNVGSCDPVQGVCKLEPRPDGTACGSQVLDNCTAKDTCVAGTCVPNDFSAGTPCGDQAKDCRFDDQCDGHGQCTDKGVWTQDTACGEHADTECDKPDTCDDRGVCQKNYAAVDAACGDQGQACKYDDACDGQGQCIDNGPLPPPCP